MLEAEPWEEISDDESIKNGSDKELLISQKNIGKVKAQEDQDLISKIGCHKRYKSMLESHFVMEMKPKRDILEIESPCQTPRKKLLFDDEKPRLPASAIKLERFGLEGTLGKFNVVKSSMAEDNKASESHFKPQRSKRDIQKNENERKIVKLCVVQDGASKFYVKIQRVMFFRMSIN